MFSQIKSNLGWVSIVILSCAPVVIWLFIKPMETRFVNVGTLFASLGQITGLVGMAMFSLVLIMSGRFKFLEDYFGGLNRAYIVHHIFGAVSFSLLLFHPLLLAGRYLSFSLRSAAIFLLPGSDWIINFGIIALTLMTILIVLTFSRLPYQIWRFSHKFFGLVLLFGGIHAFFIPSDLSNSLILKWYMFLLAGVGTATFFYRSLLSRIFVRKFKYVVEGICQLNDSVVEIEMVPKNKAMRFAPGQFLFIGFKSKDVGPEVHPFSISSDPSSSLKLTVKSLGDYTVTLPYLEKGDEAEIEGPFGRFSYQQFRNKNQIWIAGGIGITPFLSMARHIRRVRDKKCKIDLYYCVNDCSEAVLLDEFLELSKQNINFRTIPFYSEERGFLTAETVKELSAGLTFKEILICGPPIMMKNLRKQFFKLKVSSSNLHSEEFQLT